jgi:hypothetical protein
MTRPPGLVMRPTHSVSRLVIKDVHHDFNPRLQVFFESLVPTSKSDKYRSSPSSATEYGVV